MSYFKKAFGFGSLSNEKDIADELASGLDTGKGENRYTAGVSSIVSKTLLAGLIPWLSRVFTKYPPEIFHQKMAEGFDFVVDVKVNHPNEFNRYIPGARQLARRGILRLSIDQLYQMIYNMMEKRGYHMNQYEQKKIYENIVTFMQMIYSNSNSK
jgi:hypothetical protein